MAAIGLCLCGIDDDPPAPRRDLGELADVVLGEQHDVERDLGAPPPRRAPHAPATSAMPRALGVAGARRRRSRPRPRREAARRSASWRGPNDAPSPLGPPSPTGWRAPCGRAPPAAAASPSHHRLVTVANVVGTACWPSVRAIIGASPPCARGRRRPCDAAPQLGADDRVGAAPHDERRWRRRRCPGSSRRGGRSRRRSGPTIARSRGSSGMTRLPPSAASSTIASTSKRATSQARGDRRRPRPAGVAGVGLGAGERGLGLEHRLRPTPAADVSRGDRAGGGEEAERSSDGEEDGLIVAPAGGCRSASDPAPSAAGEQRGRPVAGGGERRDRRRWPGRRRSTMRVTTRSSRPRANTETARCGACGVPSSVATAGRAAGAHRPRAVGRRWRSGRTGRRTATSRRRRRAPARRRRRRPCRGS